MPDRTDTRTPPQIVGASPNPCSALAAFIGQELEHWGFAVQSLEQDGVVQVVAGDYELLVGVWEGARCRSLTGAGVHASR